jgi:PilZ domain.
VEDKRSTARKRTIKAAKIVFGDYRFVFDCTVRDISAAGARVKSEHSDEVPGEFMLFDVSAATMQPAAVIWRKGKELGISFGGEAFSIHEKNDPRLARFRFMN